MLFPYILYQGLPTPLDQMVKSVFCKEELTQVVEQKQVKGANMLVCEVGSSTWALPQVGPNPVFPRT